MDQCKKLSDHLSSSWQHEGLEFELTDVEEARRILDSESMSQFGMTSTVSPDRWKKLRRGKLPTDRALTGGAIDWLLALPPTLRPQYVSLKFPRIANALAEVWDQPQQCQVVLDKLLCDGRTGRTGFPVVVREELIALRKWKQIV